MVGVTGHMIVKNEDRFVGLAIWSVLPYLEKLLIYDTGSVDETVAEITAVQSDKIIFLEKGPVTPEEYVELRRQQIKETRTPFFMIVDGDEVWSKSAIEKMIEEVAVLPDEKLAIFCRTRNCVGDVFHYLPEEAGRYELAGRKGNYNVRIYRRVPEVSVMGVYPLEFYAYEGESINGMSEKLAFVDVWYLHATHLQRSSVVPNKKYKYELGKDMVEKELPEVLLERPLERAGVGYWVRATLETPLKKLKRRWF